MNLKQLNTTLQAICNSKVKNGHTKLEVFYLIVTGEEVTKGVLFDKIGRTSQETINENIRNLIKVGLIQSVSFPDRSREYRNYYMPTLLGIKFYEFFLKEF